MGYSGCPVTLLRLTLSDSLYNPFASLKLKGGYTSFAIYKSFNGASGFSIESLNGEVDYAIPGQPQLKEAVP